MTQKDFSLYLSDVRPLNLSVSNGFVTNLSFCSNFKTFKLMGYETPIP